MERAQSERKNLDTQRPSVGPRKGKGQRAWRHVQRGHLDPSSRWANGNLGVKKGLRRREQAVHNHKWSGYI